MSVDSDVAAVRAALLPAIARDARRRRGRRLWAAGLAVIALLGGSTAVAAATGVIWSTPKIDAGVPTVPEWTYYAHNPFSKDGGPVLLHRHPDSLAKANHAMEAKLATAGVTARCGTDAGHPLACFLPSGELVDGATMSAALAGPNGIVVIDEGPQDYDTKPLTAAEAHAWLCAHPTQRPGADGGEKPAPTEGYEDC
ncbi:hypothetical protein OM076_26215 [Solirubrobacter ginsenosidimutans]|uniref:Uncharacterized protein n=1 Tax=Solirubrobacter ginsenosidimutans TaxID=490573 RepID=A0A9X3N2T2_9ACTN|nr:hypothetical protein [Solirubrobacter ginsenosidimutans]MDA0163793.1 hypothetical protein [Solirubrobacter ginsenosidimutans]